MVTLTTRAQSILIHTITTVVATYNAIDYDNLHAFTIRAIQELSAKNDALEARIATLESTSVNT